MSMYDLLIMGGSFLGQTVGKSSLISYIKYLRNGIKERPEPTDSYSFFNVIMTYINDKYVRFLFFDISMNKISIEKIRYFIKVSTFYVFLYDPFSKRTFNKMKEYVDICQNILHNCKRFQEFPKIIVATKKDLLMTHYKEVSAEEVIQYANEIGAHFLETSIITGEGIEQIIPLLYEEELVRKGISSYGIFLKPKKQKEKDKKKNKCV